MSRLLILYLLDQVIIDTLKGTKGLSMVKKMLLLLPTFLLGIILIFTWYTIFVGNEIVTIKHKVGLIFFAVNMVACFFEIKYAVFITGIILILGTFNLVNLFVDVTYTSFFVNDGDTKFSTPAIQGKALLVLVFYLLVDGKFIFESYLKYKNKK